MKELLHSRGRGALALALGAILLLAMAASAAGANQARPFLGRATGTSTLQLLLQPIAGCPAESMFYVTEDGTGNFAHLGLVHYTLEQCAAVDWTTGEVWTTKDGSITIVAANGDRLVLSHELMGVATPMPVPETAESQVHWVVVSGTGRFASATGSGDAHWSHVYTPDGSGAVGSSVWSGTIAY